MSDVPPPPPDGSASGGTPSDPYGVPPPPSTSSDPYGAPPAAYAGGQYGQSSADPYLPDYGQHGGGDKRPGTVTAAAVTTLIFAGLAAAFTLIATIGLMVAKTDFLREVQRGLDKQDPNTTMNASTLYGAFIVVLVVFVLWSLAACLLAVFVLRRSNVARIMLLISAALTAVLSLIGLKSGVSIVTLIGAIAVIVLLVTARARAWFRQQSAPGGQQPPGQTIY